MGQKKYKIQLIYIDDEKIQFSALWDFSLDYDESVILSYCAVKPTKLHRFNLLREGNDLSITSIFVNGTNLLLRSIPMKSFVAETEEMMRIEQALPGGSLDIEITRTKQ